MFVGTKNVRGNKKLLWEQKIFVWTKNVLVNKKCSREQKCSYKSKLSPNCNGSKVLSSVAHYDIELLCLPFMALTGLVWPYLAFYGLLWPHMVLLLLFTAMAVYVHIRLSMAMYDLMWCCMAFYGLKWHFMVFYGRISYFLAVIDPNSFVLVHYHNDFLLLFKNGDFSFHDIIFGFWSSLSRTFHILFLRSWTKIDIYLYICGIYRLFHKLHQKLGFGIFMSYYRLVHKKQEKQIGSIYPTVDNTSMNDYESKVI